MAVLVQEAVSVPVLGEAEAIEVACDLAARFAQHASRRDAERVLPTAEVEELTASGLLAITVPRAYGGAGVSVATLTEVIAILAAADPNLAQIPHSHFVYVNLLRLVATPSQQRFFFGEVLAGKRIGNAQSEVGSRHVRDHATTLFAHGGAEQRGWRLAGRKGYATGALFADWIPVLAHLGEGGPLHVAWVERTAPGVSVIDDWNGMGQRTTASGTVVLDDVAVAADRVTPYAAFDRPQTYGAFAQVLHAAIDAGIARGAIAEAAQVVTTASRPYPDAEVERHADDPLVVQAFGQMELAVRAAEALTREAARAIDAADADLDAASAGRASLALAAARAATTQASVEVTSRLFEVGGTRSALDSLNLHRHWRNARTHTLHDPAAWKVQHLGRYAVDGTLPPNHGQI